MTGSTGNRLPDEVVRHVATHCLCLKTQRAARALARRFDAVLRPYELTNGQFSLLMALNRPEPPPIGRLADFLAMDRTSLTAMLKPLARRGLVRILPSDDDRRERRVHISPEGVATLAAALPAWKSEHGALDASLSLPLADRLRKDLATLASSG